MVAPPSVESDSAICDRFASQECSDSGTDGYSSNRLFCFATLNEPMASIPTVRSLFGRPCKPSRVAGDNIGGLLLVWGGQTSTSLRGGPEYILKVLKKKICPGLIQLAHEPVFVFVCVLVSQLRAYRSANNLIGGSSFC